MSRVFERMFAEASNKARAEGRSVGFADGRSAGYNACAINTARNMRKKGMSDEVIMEITELSLSELQNL